MVFGFGKKKLQFFDEISAGNTRKVRDLIMSNPTNIKDKNEHGDTVLHHAASNEPNGKTECLEALLDAPGMSFDAQNEAGWTALHGAFINGRPGAVRVLLRSGAKMDIQERTGQTPLHCGADSGNEECIAVAVDCGVEVDVRNKAGETALSIAAAGGHTSCVQALLNAKPPPALDVRTPAGRTPLHSAAERGDLAMAEALLKAGADLRATTGEGQTPADLATSAGHKAVAQRLTPKAEAPSGDALAAQALAGALGPEAEPVPQGLVAASGEARAAIQAIFDATSGGGGRGLQILQVLQNAAAEDSKVWQAYSDKRVEISLHYVRKNLGDVKTGSAEALGLEPLLSDVNETLLFYGTSPKAAKALCASDLQGEVDQPRDDADAPPKPYGPGLYFHEEAARADERAFADDAGLYKGKFAMLLCRVSLGQTVQTSDMWPDADALQAELTATSVHSIVGAREGDAGPFREFVAPEAVQAFPSYVVVYRRSDA